jgi:hypothetical protein
MLADPLLAQLADAVEPGHLHKIVAVTRGLGHGALRLLGRAATGPFTATITV